jgi:hypothetical protein
MAIPINMPIIGATVKMDAAESQPFGSNASSHGRVNAIFWIRIASHGEFAGCATE